MSSAATTVAIWATVVTSSLVFLPGIDAARVGALGLVAAAVLLAPERDRVKELAADRLFLSIVAVGVGIAGLLLVADLLRSETTFAQGDHLRLVSLLVVFAAGRALFAVSRPETTARWVGWLISVTILAVLGIMFARTGINPWSVATDAVSQGRFRPILFAFRRIHEDVNERAATATVRHFEVRAMVVGSLLGLSLLTHHSRRSSRLLASSAFALAVAASVVTFSRGNVLAVALAMTPGALWWLARTTTKWRIVVVGVLGLAAAVLLQVGVVSDAVSDGSNRSSEVRNFRLRRALEMLDEAALRGVGRYLPDGSRLRSPHNMVLDLWLGGGVLAAIGGLVLVAMAVVLTVRIGVLVYRADRFEDVLAWTGVFGLLVVVVIRMLTGGGGLMDPVSWFGFGAALAIRTRVGRGFAQEPASTELHSPN